MKAHNCLILPHETNQAVHWLDVYFRHIEGKPVDLLNLDVRWSTVAGILDPIVSKMKTAAMQGRTTISRDSHV